MAVDKEDSLVMKKPYNIFEAMNPVQTGAVPTGQTSGGSLGNGKVMTPVSPTTPPVQNAEPVSKDGVTEYNQGGVTDGVGQKAAKPGFFSGLFGGIRKAWRGSDPTKRDGGTIGYLGGLYTSPEEEERQRVRSQNKMKLLALGDAIRQFGNIYYTSKGAPAQKFDNIYEKMDAKYQREKAQRDARNNIIFNQQQREAQLEAQRERMEEQSKRAADRLAFDKDKWDAGEPERQARKEKAEADAKTAQAVAENKPKQLEAQNAGIEARTAAAESNAANNTRRTNAYIANVRDQMAKRRDNSDGNEERPKSNWVKHRDGSSWRGQSRKDDVPIQEYKNKDQWFISKDAWKQNYPRINQLISAEGQAALKKARNETERDAVARKYATSTKESYDYMRGLAHGYKPGKKQYAVRPGKTQTRTQQNSQQNSSGSNSSNSTVKVTGHAPGRL